VKITAIEAVTLALPQYTPSTAGASASITSPQYALGHPQGQAQSKPRRPSWSAEAEVANPMSRYPKFKRHRSQWLPQWGAVWCKVTLEDGTWGVGCTGYGRAVAAVIDDHLAPQLVGEDAMAGEKVADMMFRLTKPYGSTGLASYAVSAVDLALWDARGKALGQPVYKLIGGAQKDRLFCYATGNDVDWYKELGFKAFKLACPYGPADGLDGIKKNEDFVAGVRQEIGETAELMLDCWMAFDVEYTVRLAEALRPYRLKWMEECLIPEDFDAHIDLRRRLPWQGLATGEHWYTHVPFQWAAAHRVADILQPDIQWCGGLSTCLKVAAAADAAGLSVMPHGGGGTPFGQHFSLATPSVPWAEYFVGSAPGVPLEELPRLPGVPLPQDGYLVPSEAPGFGLELEEQWLVPFFS
jgi:L-rhamnonate dehydratase